MAGAIKDLVELLLTEIAIQGTDGASLAQIWEWVHSFYRAEISNPSDFHLDHALKEDLWQWLTLNPEVSVGRDRQYNDRSLSQVEAGETPPPDLRFFVSEDRTWRALTGHERDDTRVPASEFDLLSIIASCRSDGILQTDLVRRSGQDSRSVPKRTDALHTKGYIEKRPVQARSAKTSLCLFSRFARSASVTSVPVAATGGQESTLVIDIDAFAQSIFRVLKQHQIISRNDLKEELGLKDHWRWRNLSKAVRKFEAIGCLRRVRARSQFHDTMKAFHPCILLVREATEADMKLFKSDYKTLFSSMDQESADQDAEDLEEPSELQPLEHVGIRWSPDISVPNLIVDIIERSGTSGRSNAQIIKEGFGRIFRRPSENTLSRLTEGWQLSQPAHLRHSAVVRDTAQSGTVTHFVHYTYPSFKELVDRGLADWEAVTFRPRDAKSSKLVMPPPDAPAITDEDGLVPFKSPRFKTAQRDLYCVIASKGLSSYSATKSDPVATVKENGQFSASFEREYGRLFDSEVIREPREVSPAVEEVPQDDDAPSFQRVQPSDRGGKLSKSEKIEAELAKGTKPAKDVFAAFGLDESWTHVAVRLMERPAPGVYVTAKGKARPAGKKQGRPKESQIAVFKSSVLIEFLKSTVPPVEEPVQVNTSTVIVAPTPAPAEELPNVNAAEDRRGQSTDAQPVVQTAEPEAVPPVDVMDVADKTVTPANSEQPAFLERVDQTQTAQLPRDTALEETTAGAVSSTTVTPVGARETPLSDETKPTIPSSQPRVAFPRSRRSDKDGSVARLRRTIIMTLIEQAGGAFPSSSELWHAFATVWIRQYNHTETPDSRTVKSAVKYLVDAGKLRQLTFSGRTPKGEMVTRSIVMKPDLDPSDPLITDLQDKMLKSTYYVPKNIELDPNISKIVRGGSSAVASMYQKVTPVEPSMTVTLKNKPAFVVAMEKRREESLQKRLQKPVRLMGLQRKGKTSKGITSFARPSNQNKKRRIERASRRQEEGTDYDVPRSPTETRHLKHRISQPLERALAEVKRQRRESSTTAESPYRRFVGEIDYVSQWERINQNAGLSEIPPLSNPYEYAGHLSYVHHTIDEPFEQAPIDGMIEFDVDGARRRRFRRAPPAVKARRQKRAEAARIMPAQEPESQALNGHEESEMPLEDMVPQAYEPFVEPRPEEDVPTTFDNQLQEVATYSSPPQALDTVKPPMARRRRKGLRELGTRFVERLRYAIVVVRTIAGGSQGKVVDWDYVVRAFPRDDPALVRQNGKLLLNRDRRQLAQMQEDIRDILLEEYRKPNCSLPSIDFNNLENYDWDALTTWAATQYYSPSTKEVPNLPGSRAQFDRLHEYRVVQPNDQFETIYTPNPSITIAKRESMYAGRLFVHTASKRKKGDEQRKRDEMDTAKSWILSNIIAKEQTYNSVEARQKLSLFSSEVMDECVKELVRDRVIMQENRGRIIPGRNYCLTENFHHTFGRRRAIDIDMLRQAAKTKQDLDADFKRDGFSQVRYTAVDGEALAIMALAADGRVHIHPRDPPSDPTGLTEGNYETRALDKAKFKFQMVVAPDSQRYEYGNPVREAINTHPIPTVGQLDIGDEKTLENLPLWMDINGNVNHDMWQSVVSSVVGILAVRPNMHAQGICEQLQGYLALCDVNRTLGWLEGVGLASKVDREEDPVWKAKGYWWLVLNS